MAVSTVTTFSCRTDR